MEKKDFVGHLSENERQFAFREKENEGAAGIEVENLFFGTRTFFPWEAVSKNELADLLAATHQGRNIEHITRVTGYFSKVKSWNQGKVAELVDRRRTPVE